jgi:hypothetical protein
MSEWIGRAIARELVREKKVTPPSAVDGTALAEAVVESLSE